MNNNDEKLEKTLIKALELYEKGKPIPEILDLFSQYKDDLKEIFQTIEILAKRKKEILPSKELLFKIISQIPGVTKKEFARYLDRKGKENKFSVAKGRLSLIKAIKNQYTMAMKWKIIVPASVLVIAAIILIVVQFGGKKQEITAPTPITQKPSATESPAEPAATPPVATANIDDAINSFLMDSSEEINQASKYLDEEAALLGFEDQAINDFAQSYNENDF